MGLAEISPKKGIGPRSAQRIFFFFKKWVGLGLTIWVGTELVQPEATHEQGMNYNSHPLFMHEQWTWGQKTKKREG